MPETPATVELLPEEEHDPVAPEGAVGSTQEAIATLPEEMLAELWRPEYLERLARAYWRYLSRISLGLIRVVYAPDSRTVVLLSRRLPLLRFHAPEYETEPDSGVGHLADRPRPAGRQARAGARASCGSRSVSWTSRAASGSASQVAELLPFHPRPWALRPFRRLALQADPGPHPPPRDLRLPSLTRPPRPAALADRRAARARSTPARGRGGRS